MTRPPCLPFELGQERPAEVAPAPPPPMVPPAPRVLPPPPPPPVSRTERTRYRIDYGVLSIGALDVTIDGPARGATVVHANGRGEGAVLGLGRLENRISTEFDLVRLDSRRWVDARSGGDRPLSDRVDQATPGQVTFVRELVTAPGAPVTTNATLAAPLLDPLGLLLRLRVAPPAPGGSPLILNLLDGQALWRVTVTSAGRAPIPGGTARSPTLRLDAEAEPVRYDGVADVDGDRKHRSFTLWLSDDGARVPLRLEMPVGISSVVVALTEIERT